MTEGAKILLQEGATGGTPAQSVGFKAPDGDLVADVVWTLPSQDGTSGDVLSTDGDGTLVWVSQTAGAIAGQVLAFNGTSAVWVSGILPPLALNSVPTQDLYVGSAMTPLGFTLDQSGVSPITYSLHSGSLPSGLNLIDDTISGTPAEGTETGSPYGVTIRATDYVGQTDDVTFNIVVNVATGITAHDVYATIDDGTTNLYDYIVAHPGYTWTVIDYYGCALAQNGEPWCTISYVSGDVGSEHVVPWSTDPGSDCQLIIASLP